MSREQALLTSQQANNHEASSQQTSGTGVSCGLMLVLVVQWSVLIFRNPFRMLDMLGPESISRAPEVAPERVSCTPDWAQDHQCIFWFSKLFCFLPFKISRRDPQSRSKSLILIDWPQKKCTAENHSKNHPDRFDPWIFALQGFWATFCGSEFKGKAFQAFEYLKYKTLVHTMSNQLSHIISLPPLQPRTAPSSLDSSSSQTWTTLETLWAATGTVSNSAALTRMSLTQTQPPCWRPHYTAMVCRSRSQSPGLLCGYWAAAATECVASQRRWGTPSTRISPNQSLTWPIPLLTSAPERTFKSLEVRAGSRWTDWFRGGLVSWRFHWPTASNVSWFVKL